jgi:hypothetical protein
MTNVTPPAFSHPASASCAGIVITASTTTGLSTDSAAIMAIIAIDVDFSSFHEWCFVL